MEPIDPALKAILDELGLEPTAEALERLCAVIARAHSLGRLREALYFLSVTVELTIHLYNPVHPEAIGRMSYMSDLLIEADRRTEAETVQRQVIAACECAYGPEHPDTLVAVSNLAIMLHQRSDLAGAERLQRRVFEAFERIAGLEHLHTLTAMINLSATLDARGDLANAEDFRHRVRLVIKAMHNRVTSMHAGGDLAGAEELERCICDVFMRLLGPEHDNTLNAMNNLVITRLKRGDLSGSERLARIVVDIRKHVSGSEHPEALTAMSNLAATLLARGDTAGAEKVQRDVLATFNRVLGSQDLRTVAAVGNLATTLHRSGDRRGAEQLQHQVVGILERVSDPEDPDTLTAKANLAAMLHYRGDFAGAERLLRGVCKTFERVSGPEHPDTLRAVGDLARTLHHRGEVDGAEDLERRVLEALERVLGPEHPHTLVAMTNLASTLYARGDLSRAEEQLSGALHKAAFLRSSISGMVERAMLSDVAGLSFVSGRLSAIRTRLDRPAASVLEALEAGTSRSILDLLQTRGTDLRALAAALKGSGVWSKQQYEEYLLDLARSAELEHAQNRMIEGGVPFNDSVRREQSQEHTAVRESLHRAERDLLPSARPHNLSQICAALDPGEFLLVYGWNGFGVSLVAVPHQNPGQASGHWISRAEKSARVFETVKREQELIGVIQSVAVAIAAGLAPDPDIAEEVSKALRSIEAANEGGFPLSGLDEQILLDIRELVEALQAAKQLNEDLDKRVPVASMRLDSLRALSRVLLDFIFPAEIHPMLSEAERVVVVPSGPLHELPLDVLVELAGFEELMNKPVTVVPSGSILALLRSRGGETHPNGVTAVGDPEADVPGGLGEDRGSVSELEVLLGDRAGGNGRLPRAGTEARLVASYFDDEAILGRDATPQRVHAEAPGRRVVHLSAHAVLGAMGEPMASAVLLTGERDENGDVRGGRLTLADLIATWGDRLSGCEMAVLSCCQTGRGVTVGDSVMALPIGLLHAGVNRVVASLWKVQDLATCLLMMRFYQNYLGVHRDERGEADPEPRSVWGRSFAEGQTMSTPEALAEAKRWLRELTVERLSIIKEKVLDEIDPPTDKTAMSDEVKRAQSDEVAFLQHAARHPDRPPFAEPRYWAAFTIIGNP